MAIVWACRLTVEEYVAADRDVEVPRPDCPDCKSVMSFRSGYRRGLRLAEVEARIWVRRATCRPCGKSHALLPSFCLQRRFDPVTVIGAVIEAVVGAGRGVRRAVAGMTVPHTTARDWVRRFRDGAATLVAGFAVVAVELGEDGFVPAGGAPSVAAVGALRAAWRALTARVGLRAPRCWAFASLITGGRLISTTTDPLSIFLGRRPLMPPAP